MSHPYCRFKNIFLLFIFFHGNIFWHLFCCTTSLFLCLFSLIYEQSGGAVYITTATAAEGSYTDDAYGTFISCSWNGNSAPSGKVSNMFQNLFSPSTNFIITRYHFFVKHNEISRWLWDHTLCTNYWLLSSLHCSTSSLFSFSLKCSWLLSIHFLHMAFFLLLFLIIGSGQWPLPWYQWL